MNKNIKSVIFDLDGTLLDTLLDIANCSNQMLENNDFPVHSIESYKYFIGDGAYMLIKRILPEMEKNSLHFHKYLEDFQEIYRNEGTTNAILYQGVEELLNELVSRNIKLNILSNKPHELTKIVVQQKLANWKFDNVFGQRNSIARKPDPAGALEIMKKQGYSNTEYIFIGDTAIDIKTAIAANIIAVGVLWGFREAKELTQAGAKYLIQHPQELLDVLDKQDNLE